MGGTAYILTSGRDSLYTHKWVELPIHSQVGGAALCTVGGGAGLAIGDSFATFTVEVVTLLGTLGGAGGRERGRERKREGGREGGREGRRTGREGGDQLSNHHGSLLHTIQKCILTLWSV